MLPGMPLAGTVGRLASAFAENPVQTARGIFQGVVLGAGISWIVFGFYGWHLAKNKGEPQAERVYDASKSGISLGGTTEGGEGSGGGASGEAADTGGTLSEWNAWGLRYAGAGDGAENLACADQNSMAESGGDPLAIQGGYVDVNTGAPADPSTGFSTNEARGHHQITPNTWMDYAPSEFQPASDWIFKPRANAAVYAIYCMKKYGYLVCHSGY